MLVALAAILLILAIAGGVAMSPVVFFLAGLALLVFLVGRRRGTTVL
jgi:hypothetical protein